MKTKHTKNSYITSPEPTQDNKQFLDVFLQAIVCLISRSLAESAYVTGSCFPRPNPD